MPRVPVPADVAELLARPYLAVIATVRPDGSPHTTATWYDWDDGRILLNMADTRKRLEHLRRDPRVALTVMTDGEAFDHVSVLGRVVSIEPDGDLRDIDRLALRYTGKPFGTRNQPRFSAWLEPERWHTWPLPSSG